VTEAPGGRRLPATGDRRPATGDRLREILLLVSLFVIVQFILNEQ
jgi:hypothetical protein